MSVGCGELGAKTGAGTETGGATGTVGLFNTGFVIAITSLGDAGGGGGLARGLGLG